MYARVQIHSIHDIYVLCENLIKCFLNCMMWSTRYHDGEMLACGRYPNQSVADGGLSKYIADNESINGQDLVVWCTQVATYHPRMEDWPAMPMVHVSLKIEPDGFFDRNPAIDIPPTR